MACPVSRYNPSSHQVGRAKWGRAGNQRRAEDAGDHLLYLGWGLAALCDAADREEEEEGAEAEEAAR